MFNPFAEAAKMPPPDAQPFLTARTTDMVKDGAAFDSASCLDAPPHKVWSKP